MARRPMLARRPLSALFFFPPREEDLRRHDYLLHLLIEGPGLRRPSPLKLLQSTI